jgi:hypothetical protein
MTYAHRKKAEQVIQESIQMMYPKAKLKPNTGNYILNQLLKAGYTNDKIMVHVSEPEVQKELEQAVFKCRTDCGPDCQEDE